MSIFFQGQRSEAEILRWLQELRRNAHVPESRFAVAAVLRARLGGMEYYFAGVNVENPDHRTTTHGEEGALAAMVTGLGPGAEIAELWVMGGPESGPGLSRPATCCGKCRQQIAGFAAPAVKIHAFSPAGQKATTTVGAFLPETFSFRDYLPAAGQKAEVPPPSSATVGQRLVRRGQMAEAAIAAWLAALRAVAPVSGISQAVVLHLSTGLHAAGVKIEDAAFLSVSAAQAALAAGIAAGGPAKITAAWVQTRDAEGRVLPPAGGGALSLASCQALAALAEHAHIPVRLMGADGSPARVLTLAEAAASI